MLPNINDYRAYGRKIGRKELSDVQDWDGFSQMKRWDHGFLPRLRRIAGYNDPFESGTYTECPSQACFDAYDALIEGVRLGAMGE